MEKIKTMRLDLFFQKMWYNVQDIRPQFQSANILQNWEMRRCIKIKGFCLKQFIRYIIIKWAQNYYYYYYYFFFRLDALCVYCSIIVYL